MLFQNLLICYYPGARGDFLASFLLNRLALQHNWFIETEKIKFDSIEYKKVHYYEILAVGSHSNKTCNINDLIKSLSLRIQINSFSDCLTVSYYNKAKIKTSYMTFEDTFEQLLYHEIQHRKLNSFFNRIINFKDLQDINYLTSLYTDIMNLQLTSDDIHNVQFNLDKNPVITLNNYSSYIDVDIDRLIKKYEQTFRIGAD